MTQYEWGRCTEPQEMLLALRVSWGASDRKLRLFAVACCRLLLRQVRVVAPAEHAVDVAERYADGAASVAELRAVARYANSTAEHACMNAAEEEAGTVMADCAAGNAAWAATQPGTRMPDDNGRSAARLAAEEARQSDLLRCTVGPALFRPLPPVAPAVLAWNGGTVGRLAAGVYEGRDFSQERLGVLADAAEEAGLDDAELLAHLRSPGLHARGCWGVDLLLGRT
jgi:hypothetical protein